MKTNGSSDDLTALERLTRMFNMGEYGEKLAQQILDQYLAEVFIAERGGYYDSDEHYTNLDYDDPPGW